MKPLNPLPKDIWPDIPRTIAPSAIALGALVRFYTSETEQRLPHIGNLDDIEARIEAVNHPHIRNPLIALYALFRYLLKKDLNTKQPHEDPLCYEEAQRIPDGLLNENMEEIIGQALIAYMVRYNHVEATKTYNLWVKNQLGLPVTWSNPTLPDALLNIQRMVHESLELHHQVELEDPEALAFIAESYRHGKWGTKKDDQQSFYWGLKAALKGHALSQICTSANYGAGLGTKANFHEAHAWRLVVQHTTDLPQDIQHKADLLRTTLHQSLTQDEITKAQARATQILDLIKENTQPN